MNGFDMKIREEIVKDEIDCIASDIVKRSEGKVSRWTGKLNGKMLFVCDRSPMGPYLMRAYRAARSKRSFIHEPTYVNVGGSFDQSMQSDFGEIRRESLGDLKFSRLSRDVVFVLIDCRRSVGESETYLNALSEINRKMGKRPHRVAVGVVLPEVPPFPEGLEALSEREYGYYLEHKVPRTPEINYYLQIEKACRELQRKGRKSVYIVRFANVFAPDDCDTADVALGKIVDEAFDAGQCSVSEVECTRRYALTAVRSACRCMDMMLYTDRSRGNVYQFYDYAVTDEDVKRQLSRSFPGSLKYRSSIGNLVSVASNVISRLRISRFKIGSWCPFDVAIKRVANYRRALPYDNLENVAFYEGRIKAIQRAELEILKEIDRICRKYGIQYFLAGGTLLGQVRCGGPIPWDDDLDIGMLRQDYEKFRRVAAKELSPEFCYTCPYNRSGSHYTIDKVRIRNSYFSTRFSAANIAQDGVFVDILVYDQTSNVAWLRNLQLFILSVITFLLEIKWFNRARKNLHYGISLVALPILRLIPFWVFHRVFDHVAKWFSHGRNAQYLIDTVGKKLRDGPMPFQGMKEVVYADFAGVRAPIPIDPAPYLTYAFGPNYIEQPVLSKRCCPHNFARIDLGRHVFGEHAEADRQVNLKGELFEA